jgi:hypothetical protein
MRNQGPIGSLTLCVAIRLGMAACAGAMFAAAAAAQQFSADLVSAGAEGMAVGTPGRIHVSNGKMRLETPEVRSGFFVIDGSANTAYFVKPAQRIFMDARQSSVLAQIFVPVDPADPCARWQAMAKLSGAADNGGEWRCQQTGKDTIDGRETTTYRAVSPQQRSYLAWIDQTLKIPLRIETNYGSTFWLKDISEAPQPAALFEVPANFQKFDPQGLIDRIKQSDVWVEPMQ